VARSRRARGLARLARRTLVAAGLGFVAITAIGANLVRQPSTAAAPVAVAAIEPGFHPHREAVAAERGRWLERLQQLVQERLVAPTRDVLAAPAPPDVVLWPESSVRDRLPLPRERLTGGGVRSPLGALPPRDARLVLGVDIAEHDGGLAIPAAVMFDLRHGRSVDHHEKRVLVPGGEFPPLYGWLPRAIGDTLRGWVESVFRFYLPEASAGSDRPPLRGPRDVPFGTLICYDNAYAGPAALQVAQGARWLAVLSNESWFEGGGELVQLVAMSVLRALETATPIVRCTMDGWSCAIDADGRVIASLPPPHGPGAAARILRVEVTPGPGRLPPLAWLRHGLGPAMGIATLALLLLRLLACARLRAARPATRSEPSDPRVGG
jgi:apolipoprotein N-acyltransferase